MLVQITATAITRTTAGQLLNPKQANAHQRQPGISYRLALKLVI